MLFCLLLSSYHPIHGFESVVFSELNLHRPTIWILYLCSLICSCHRISPDLCPVCHIYRVTGDDSLLFRCFQTVTEASLGICHLYIPPFCFVLLKIKLVCGTLVFFTRFQVSVCFERTHLERIGLSHEARPQETKGTTAAAVAGRNGLPLTAALGRLLRLR